MSKEKKYLTYSAIKLQAKLMSSFC